MSSSTETETWPLATLTRKIRQRMQALVEDPALKPRELIMLGRLVDRLAAHEAETAQRRSAGPSLSDLIAAAEQRRTIHHQERAHP